MEGMWGLQWWSSGYEDKVHPGIILGLVNEVGILLHEGLVWISKQGLFETKVIRKGAVGPSGPLVRGTVALYAEFDRLVGLLRQRDRRVVDNSSFVEASDVCGSWLSRLINRRSGSVEVGGILVRKNGVAVDYLVDAGTGNTYGILRGLLVELYHSRITIAIGKFERIDSLGLNVMAVDGIDPHRVFVNGDR